DWYHELRLENLRDFEILPDLFLERYRHCAAYTPTITDLFKEKMKPNDDLVGFIQRWRALAARCTCALLEPEQIQMIVRNMLPSIYSRISITGCPTTFAQLYQRGAQIQSALKDPSFQLYNSRSKPTKKDQGPVTEGITINEQVGLVNHRPNPSQAAI